VSERKFWAIPIEIDLCGYRLKFRYPSIEAAADANEIREAGAAEPPTLPFRERARAYWKLVKEHLASIEKDGEILSADDRAGLMESSVFAPWINQIVTACFFRDTLIAVANSRGGPGGPGARPDEGEGDPERGSGREVPGLSDDLPGEGVSRLAGHGASQRGVVSGVREEEGAIEGNAPLIEVAGSNGRRGRVQAGGTTRGGVGRGRKAKA
jgi:hypothetical protein